MFTLSFEIQLHKKSLSDCSIFRAADQLETCIWNDELVNGLIETVIFQQSERLQSIHLVLMEK